MPTLLNLTPNSTSFFSDLSDNPDVGGNSSAHGSVTPPPQPLNFGSAGSGDMGLPYMTTESLLRKIQALLKAAADKIRDDDRALNFEKGEWTTWWTLGVEQRLSNFLLHPTR